MNPKTIDILIDIIILLGKGIFYLLIFAGIFCLALLAGSAGPWCF